MIRFFDYQCSICKTRTEVCYDLRQMKIENIPTTISCDKCGLEDKMLRLFATPGFFLEAKDFTKPYFDQKSDRHLRSAEKERVQNQEKTKKEQKEKEFYQKG